MELEETKKQAGERISELETQLMQATKETELLKVSAAWRSHFNKIHDTIKMEEIMTVINNNEKSGGSFDFNTE